MQAPRRIGSVELPPIDQVGYVVRDLEATLERYAHVFGPFTRMESKLTGVRYRGRPCDVHLDMAFGSTGNLEIEFIAVRGGESPHSEFLAAGREGIHHIRYRVPDCDAMLAALHGEGFEPIWYHDMGFAKFAYLEHASRDGVLIELLEMRGEAAPTS
ncbi:MAG TPA: VOC family protein [Myxococcota bacterium]|jgi:methylmalonyl-CoA/ethylmalonyl-CoA epimerase|nr:VOC family protein [Myxococcota bacterium]